MIRLHNESHITCIQKIEFTDTKRLIDPCTITKLVVSCAVGCIIVTMNDLTSYIENSSGENAHKEKIELGSASDSTQFGFLRKVHTRLCSSRAVVRG